MNINNNYGSSSLTDKKDRLMTKLTEFFTLDKKNIDKMLPIVREEHKISLRILDWFVTNYSKKYNINYTKTDGNQFNVYLKYKDQLKAYSKRQFDPFRRRERITFYYETKKCIATTVGQLNFFKWAIENEILNYVLKNYSKIEDDMMKSMREKYKNKKKKINNSKLITKNNNNSSSKKHKKQFDTTLKSKRKELSISATKTVTKQYVKVIVTFD